MESLETLVAETPVKKTRKPKSIAVKPPTALHKIKMIEFKKNHFPTGRFKFNTSDIKRIVYHLKDGNTTIETNFVEFKPTASKCKLDYETYLESETGTTFKLDYTSTKYKRSEFDFAIIYTFEDKPFYSHEFNAYQV